MRGRVDVAEGYGDFIYVVLVSREYSFILSFILFFLVVVWGFGWFPFEKNMEI